MYPRSVKNIDIKFYSPITNYFAPFLYIYSEKIPAGYHGKNLAQSLGIMSLVLMAFNYTGGFFHPVIATARNYGCRGYFRELTSLDHFIVYWIGAILGAIISNILTTKLTKKIDQNK